MVKRYTLTNGLLHPHTLAEHTLFTGEQDVVLAADYDALAAELAASENGFNNACRSLHEAEARVHVLEAALQETIEYARQTMPPSRYNLARAALAAPASKGEQA